MAASNKSKNYYQNMILRNFWLFELENAKFWFFGFIGAIGLPCFLQQGTFVRSKITQPAVFCMDFLSNYI